MSVPVLQSAAQSKRYQAWRATVEHDKTQSSKLSPNTKLTLAFIFGLMMKFKQADQFPLRMALDAATMCSRMDSGGPSSGCLSLERSCW